jgi:hypothetical protein
MKENDNHAISGRSRLIEYIKRITRGLDDRRGDLLSKFDFKKEYKDLYMPKARPVLINWQYRSPPFNPGFFHQDA